MVVSEAMAAAPADVAAWLAAVGPTVEPEVAATVVGCRVELEEVVTAAALRVGVAVAGPVVTEGLGPEATCRIARQHQPEIGFRWSLCARQPATRALGWAVAPARARNRTLCCPPQPTCTHCLRVRTAPAAIRGCCPHCLRVQAAIRRCCRCGGRVRLMLQIRRDCSRKFSRALEAARAETTGPARLPQMRQQCSTRSKPGRFGSLPHPVP